jgi:hypothetical protein
MDIFRNKWTLVTVCVLLILPVMSSCMHAHAQTQTIIREVALKLHEPWDDMRKRSSAEINPVDVEDNWGTLIANDARLRFVDPRYGFVTPPARFFSISYDNRRVRSVRMSPQIETLLLDDALKIVLDLQSQWETAGWKLSIPKESPKIADTFEARTTLRGPKGSLVTFWNAEDKAQVMLSLARFPDSQHPTEVRYLITLALAEPWVKQRTGPLPPLKPRQPPDLD